MRWWRVGGCVVALVGVLAGCGASGGGGPTAKGPSESASGRTPAGTSTRPSVPSASAASPVPSAAGCAARQAEVTVAPGDPLRRQMCVRPGTVVSLVLRPRTDDKRWTAVRSSAPVFVLVSGWRVAADGTAHASLRSAGTRGGSAEITASAREPDVAGPGGVVFTLDVTVRPYAREG